MNEYKAHVKSYDKKYGEHKMIVDIGFGQTKKEKMRVINLKDSIVGKDVLIRTYKRRDGRYYCKLIKNPSLYQYKGYVHSVHDGDGKYEITLDQGLGCEITRECRLNGVDTPEIRGVQKPAGDLVGDYVADIILHKNVLIKTFKDKSGKYGRLMVDTPVFNGWLSEDLIAKKYAHPFSGRVKRTPWTKAQLDNIIHGMV